MSALKPTILGAILGALSFSGAVRGADFAHTDQRSALHEVIWVDFNVIQPKPPYSPFPATAELNHSIAQLRYPGDSVYIPPTAVADEERKLQDIQIRRSSFLPMRSKDGRIWFTRWVPQGYFDSFLESAQKALPSFSPNQRWPVVPVTLTAYLEQAKAKAAAATAPKF